MNKLKINEKGITLIALVITIIVLLILAGVAINMAIDSDGLFGKANEAVEGWNTTVEEERTAIQDLLDELGVKEPIDLPEGWDPAKVADIVTEGTRKAPIPEGFVASQIIANAEGKGAENTISVGLVIYQGDDPVTGTAGNEAHNTAMTTRNQFVWIPVDDINYMVMCEKNNKEEGNYVENGETITTKICKLELSINEETKKEELVCKTHNSKDLCGRVYATTSPSTNPTTTADGKKIYTYTQTFNETEWASQTWDTSNYREPDIVSYYDDDYNKSYLTAAGVTTASELRNQLKTDFTAMATSVAKYGGFYVSRYEAGENGASLKNQKVLVAGTDTSSSTTGSDIDTLVNGNMWYGMYNTLRTSSVINKTAVNSHIIWGSQYDMIIKFLGENSLNGPQVAHTTRPLATQELTGETTTDIMSNIYDLEGNNSEWTAQANFAHFRAYRGGSFFSVASSQFYPASSRSHTLPHFTICYFGSRSALYVQ